MYQVSSDIWSDGSELNLVWKKKEEKKGKGMEGEWVQAYPISSKTLTIMVGLSGKEENKMKREKSSIVW